MPSLDTQPGRGRAAADTGCRLRVGRRPVLSLPNLSGRLRTGRRLVTCRQAALSLPVSNLLAVGNLLAGTECLGSPAAAGSLAMSGWPLLVMRPAASR